jgi:homoserine dehydrogenase
MSEVKNIGLFGFGCVGQGFYKILQATDINARVKSIGVVHPGKQRPIPEDIFTFNPDDILNDPDINLIVEAITDHVSAYNIVREALKKGIPVVTANKKMVATYLSELLDLQKEYHTPLLYEASCCGAIPIVRTLDDYYGMEPLTEVSGIFNGSSNFILSKMREEGLGYSEAVKLAQELGFAEADPTLDVGGYDSLNKLCILTMQAFGIVITPESVYRYGIQNLSTADLALAGEASSRLKLLAHTSLSAKGLGAYVAPVFVPYGTDLYNVENEFNAVHVGGAYSDNQLYRGKGAGSLPTGLAVFADTVAVINNYRYQYAKGKDGSDTSLADLHLEVYIRIPQHSPSDYILPEGNWFELDKERIYVGSVTLKWLRSHQIKMEQEGLFIAIIPDKDGFRELIIKKIKEKLAVTA